MVDESGSAPGASGSGVRTASLGTGSSFVALKTGLAIRHYIIEEVIGAGGFGITYRARHERLASKVFALKEFFPRQFAARHGTHVVSTADGDGLFRWGLDRFLKEAEALAKCDHPGIVDVVDYFEENGTAYAVLGYVDGRQLGQWLDSLGRAPTQAELDRVLMPLLDALEAVHEAKLLHRDIAPDNILIRRDGSPCLIDFGACREDIRDRSRKISAIVKHGYSPPEQYHGIAELQGPWTDIYAVAATLYRAMSGAAPMDSSRRGALGDTLKPASEVAASDYRAGFLAAIDAALKLKPDERPASIAEWRKMLLSDAPAAASAHTLAPASVPVAGGHGMQSAAPGAAAGSTGSSGISLAAPAALARPTATVVPARRGSLIATAAVLALLAIGAVAWWRIPDRPPDVAPKTKDVPGKVGLDSPTAKSPQASEAPSPDPEARAQAAWRPLAGSTDIAAIERFVAEHGATQAASAARARLATLREDARRKEAAERAKAEAEARAGHQQTLNANWQTCSAAAEQARATACAAVIQGDDTLARRAAALHLVGMAARNSGDYDTAIATFTRSLALVPNDPQVLNDRGISHFLKGGAADHEAAMRDYDSALRAEPRHAEALNNRAWSLFRAGRTADALLDANRSIEVAPTNGYAYDTRGQILEALDRKDDAIRDFERALSIDPKQDTSRAALARLRASGR